MRIALVGPVFPYRGGIAHYTTALAKTFEKQEHDLLVVSFKRQYPNWLYPGKSDKDPSHQAFTIENPNYWMDSLNPLTWISTFLKIRSFEPDVIVLQWWTTFFAPLWFTLALLNKIYLARPLIFICHNVLPHEKNRLDVYAVRLVLRFATHVIVQSDAEEARLITLLPNSDISVVPHPVYDIFEQGTHLQQDARAQLGLANGDLILLFFGIVRAYKGLAELLYALVEVKRQSPSVKLLVVGEFWESKVQYGRLIHQLALDEQVLIEDRYVPNEEVALYFTAADLLVAPYRQHTGSGVIQLAAALNLPVVTMPEMVAASISSLPSLNFELTDKNTQPIDSDTTAPSPKLLSRANQLTTAICDTISRFCSESSSGRVTDSQNAGAAVTQTPGSTWDDLARTITQRVFGK